MSEHNTPQRRYLRDYQSPAWQLESLELDFILHETRTRVRSRMHIKRLRDEPLRLYGDAALQLCHIAVDGVSLPRASWPMDGSDLLLTELPEQGLLELETEINPQANTALEGLYLSAGKFCTQCEPEGFRRITFFPDRPDVMTRYRVRIEADRKRYPVLLSNGNLLAQGDVSPERHYALWEDPFPKPCYLFALVAGDLAHIEDSFTTASGRTVALRVYTEAHNIARCDFAMASLKKAMRWDEEHYGREYDLDLFMMVAVDDFNMGAMENKGLNIYNAKCVLASRETATDADFLQIEGIIAHEYFHNWTGDRITCRDWFQLSLKEGLTVFRDQRFSETVYSKGVQRIQDINRLRSLQFAEDSGPGAHPVRPDSYIEINNFYTLTIYEKGAELVRMQHSLLGTAGFRRGTDLYFARHDGQAVTIEDFVSAMEDANTADLQQFRRWYEQAGTPKVQLHTVYDAAQGCLHMHWTQQQSDADHPPLHIPIRFALLDADSGQPLPLHAASEDWSGQDEAVFSLREAQQSLTLTGLSAAPVVSPLRGLSAPIRLDYAAPDADLCLRMRHDADPFCRWDAGQQLATRLIQDELAGNGARAQSRYTLFSQAWGHYLDGAMEHDDPAMLAELLRLPSIAFLLDSLQPLDPVALERIHQRLHKDLLRDHQPAWQALYDALRAQQQPWAFARLAIGRRRLQNLALAMLCSDADSAALERAVSQYQQADSMTLAQGALQALNDVSCAERSDCMEHFYQRWHNDPLVTDKWLQLHACSRLPNALERVQELQQHPSFTMANPNRVRALIGAFAQGNVSGFHRADGAGYDWLAEQIMTLDARNPQIASRLLGPLLAWRSYDEGRQLRMQAALRRIQADAASPDVRERVNQALAP